MNFRDLGGLLAERVPIAHGRLFRTGHLSQLDAVAAQHVCQALGIRTYVDFRTDDEIGRDGSPSELIVRGVHWERQPFDIADDVFRAARIPAPQDWLGMYLRAVERLRPVLANAVRAIAHAEPPVVFGCWAGRDRTGIVSALVLSLLGVPDDAIAADYARTTEGLAAFADRFAFLWSREPEKRVEIFDAYCTTSHAVMIDFMRELRERFGSARDLLALDSSVIDQLRARLLSGHHGIAV
jgi:protein-tyrosine phosphatase